MITLFVYLLRVKLVRFLAKVKKMYGFNYMLIVFGLVYDVWRRKINFTTIHRL